MEEQYQGDTGKIRTVSDVMNGYHESIPKSITANTVVISCKI